MRRGLVLGCGATVGCAWSIGMLAAAEESLDWDSREAEVIIGTSAGAELALMLGSGCAPGELIAAERGDLDADLLLAAHFRNPGPRPGPPRPAPGNLGALAAGLRRQAPALNALSGLLPAGSGQNRQLARLADALAPGGGWVQHPATWMVAMDAASGRRVAFGSSGAPAAAVRDAVRASWAVPGLFAAVEIGGRRYADGGVLSPTSADLALGLRLDELIVIAPMASRKPGRAASPFALAERAVRAGMTARLDREIAALRAAGTRVVRIEPGERDLAIMGANFMDGRRRLPALAAAITHGPERVAEALAAA